MKRYRKKPVIIEAVQFTGDNQDTITDWSDMQVFDARHIDDDYKRCPRDNMLVETLEGDMLVSVADWIIKGIADEFYPCKPSIFEATYEPVDA